MIMLRTTIAGGIDTDCGATRESDGSGVMSTTTHVCASNCITQYEIEYLYKCNESNVSYLG